MINFIKKYSDLPTIMDYDDEVATIRDLINFGALHLVQDREGLISILSKIEESHQDNGVFEFKQADGDVFGKFVNLLYEIRSLDPNLGANLENMIFTFSSPGFD